MTALARREDILENRFVHEQTMHFNCEARRNKALAKWAADLLGKTDQEADDYQGSIIALALKTGSDAVLVERISLDLAMAGAAVSQVQVRRQLDKFWAEAKLTSA